MKVLVLSLLAFCMLVSQGSGASLNGLNQMDKKHEAEDLEDQLHLEKRKVKNGINDIHTLRLEPVPQHVKIESRTLKDPLSDLSEQNILEKFGVTGFINIVSSVFEHHPEVLNAFLDQKNNLLGKHPLLSDQGDNLPEQLQTRRQSNPVKRTKNRFYHGSLFGPGRKSMIGHRQPEAINIKENERNHVSKQSNINNDGAEREEILATKMERNEKENYLQVSYPGSSSKIPLSQISGQKKAFLKGILSIHDKDKIQYETDLQRTSAGGNEIPKSSFAIVSNKIEELEKDALSTESARKHVMSIPNKKMKKVLDASLFSTSENNPFAKEIEIRKVNDRSVKHSKLILQNEKQFEFISERPDSTHLSFYWESKTPLQETTVTLVTVNERKYRENKAVVVDKVIADKLFKTSNDKTSAVSLLRARPEGYSPSASAVPVHSNIKDHSDTGSPPHQQQKKHHISKYRSDINISREESKARNVTGKPIPIYKNRDNTDENALLSLVSHLNSNGQQRQQKHNSKSR